jgi:acyl carrier protein
MIGRENEKLADSDSLLSKGIIDSTGVLELVGFLEENYRIAVEENELVPDNLDSIDNLAKYIQNKKGR